MSDEQRERRMREYHSDPTLIQLRAYRSEILMKAVPKYIITDTTFSDPIFDPAIQRNLNLLNKWIKEHIENNYSDLISKE